MTKETNLGYTFFQLPIGIHHFECHNMAISLSIHLHDKHWVSATLLSQLSVTCKTQTVYMAHMFCFLYILLAASLSTQIL